MKAEWNAHCRLMAHAKDIVLEAFRLLPQGFRIAPYASSKTAAASIWCIGDALLVVERICQIELKAALVSQHASDLVENLTQVTNGVIGMWLMSELPLSDYLTKSSKYRSDAAGRREET
jgi:hypothetical protein